MDGNQVSSMLFPEKMSLPGFDVILCAFRGLPGGSLYFRLSGPHMTGSRPAFSVTFTTSAIERKQLTVV